MLVVRVSFSFITFSFFLIHIASTEDQGDISMLVNEEYHKISAIICLTKCRIDIFFLSVSSLNEEISRSIKEDFLSFILSNMMFDCQFFNEIWQPNKVINKHMDTFRP